jgi:serine/threonine protein kinase
VTPLYRAPEIFLDVSEYSSSVDIWSVGCIFAEMVNRKPLFNGNNEMDVMVKIFQLLGKPDYKQNTYREMKLNRFEHKPKTWQEICPTLDQSGLDLISNMLVLDPENRISASQALAHKFLIE